MTVVDSFVEWAHSGLMQSEEAQSYLLGRGVSKSQFEKHRLGFVIGEYHPDPSRDPGHSDVCRDRKLAYKWCDSCRLGRWSSMWVDHEDGPFTQHIGRRILGCVVFPLTTYSGTTYGFQLRNIKEKMFDSFFLLKKPEGVFFGVGPNMDLIWSSREVFVTEGPFDHLVFERLISPNIVGLTTNAPGEGHVRFFKRFVERAGLFLDADKAGRDGAESFSEYMGDSVVIEDFKIDVKTAKGSKCKDLNEAWVALGDKKFSAYITSLIERKI